MIDPTILVATQWWFRDRLGDKVDNRVITLIPTAFFSINSLYQITRNYSLPSISGRSSGKQISDSGGIHLGMFPHPEKYATFRAAISLTGDIYNILGEALKFDLMELKSGIQNLYDAANKFREVRNFFTHLDDELGNLENHGVNGPLKTEFGVEYTDTAKNRFHLVIHDETIYFTRKKKAQKAFIGKSAFNPIFEAARPVYKQLTSHKLYAEKQNYDPAEKLFPLDEKLNR